MRKFLLFIIFLSAFVLISDPSTSAAAPREVTLFPDDAHVTEVTRIRLSTLNPEQQKAVFLLPPKADLTSLTCGFGQATNLELLNLSWRQLNSDDSESLKILRILLKKIQDEHLDLLAHTKALETQILFWQAQAKAKAKSTAEAAAVSGSLGRNMKMLYKDKLAKELELKVMDKQLNTIKNEISKQENSKEALWEVTALLSGPQTSEATLTYSYQVGGCGWEPHHRIEADTQAGKLMMQQEASIRQTTGMDWKQVMMRITTQPSYAGTSRSTVRHGIVSGRENPTKKEDGGEKARPQKHRPPFDARPDHGALYGNADPMAAMIQRAGLMDLPSGQTRSVIINKTLLPAEFSYLLKPAISPHALVRAAFQERPPTAAFSDLEAQVLIDGNMAAQKRFSLWGEETFIDVGIDTQVTVDRRLLKQSTVESGMDKNIVERVFLIEIANAKDAPVKIILEETLPPSTDKTGKQTILFDPAPTDQDKMKATWTFELPAGGMKAVSAFYRYEMPSRQ